MAVNKVVLGDETLIDLSNDTVTPKTLVRGVTATDASGEQIVGELGAATSTSDGLMSAADKKKLDTVEEGANKISVRAGSVTTLPAGTSAYITNSGTETDPVFNFFIPQGNPGRAPVKGADYWTETDKAEIVEEVLEQVPESESLLDENGKIADQYLPDDIGGSGADLLNPFGIIKQEVLPEGYPYAGIGEIVVPMQTGEYEAAGAIQLSYNKNLENEKTYIARIIFNGIRFDSQEKVVVDGVYVGVAKKPEGDGTIPSLGIVFMTEHGKFSVDNHLSRNTMSVHPIFGTGTCSICVAEVVEAVKIDEKYLPDNLVNLMGEDGLIKKELLPPVGDEVLNEFDLVKREALPAGYPYETIGEIIIPKQKIVYPGGASPVISHSKLPEIGKTYCARIIFEGYSKEAQKNVVIDGIYRGVGYAGGLGAYISFETEYGIFYVSSDTSYDSTNLQLIGAGTCIICVAEEGEVVKIDEKYLPFVAENGTIKEEALPDSVKTIGDNGIIKQQFFPNGFPYVTEKEVFPKTEYKSMQASYSVGVDLKNGKSYIVNVDGINYTCSATSVSDGINDFVLLGNMGNLGGVDNGMPFTIVASATELMFAKLRDGYQGTFSISEPTTIPIDMKFLPEGYPNYSSVSIEAVVEISEDDGNGMLPNIVNATIGNTYTVNWNGTEYECECVAFSGEGMVVPSLGNVGAIMGSGDTGEPFVIMMLTPEQAAMMGAGVMVMPLDGSTSVELSITGGSSTPIAQNLLPEGYPYPGEGWVLPETNFDLVLEGEGLPCSAMIQEKFELKVGKTYNITWDGTTYKCVAIAAEGVCVGNVGLLTGGVDTGEPFIIMSVPEEFVADFGGYGMVMDLVSQESHTVTVSIDGGQLTKLDPKYLPMDYIVQEVLANLTNGNEVAY